MRTVDWDVENKQVRLIDQRLLPGRFEVVAYENAEELAKAIREMVVRGAPAIGATAAYGIALAAWHCKASQPAECLEEIRSAEAVLRASRPTAVNLFWALERMMRVANEPSSSIGELRERLECEAQRIADEDVETNRAMSLYGASLIEDGDTIIHHCNTGALAVVDGGTALGCIHMAHEQGKHVHVLVDETRPRLQGARLTAWELSGWGIPYDIISDNAAGFFLHSGQVNKVFYGADRVAANGDVANKIGSYMLALAAHANGVPVYSVMPTTTIDLALASGDLIPIEERDMSEVLDIQIHGERVTPEGATARNPAFDVTPNGLISAIVTEKGVVYPPFSTNLPLMMRIK